MRIQSPSVRHCYDKDCHSSIFAASMSVLLTVRCISRFAKLATNNVQLNRQLMQRNSFATFFAPHSANLDLPRALATLS